MPKYNFQLTLDENTSIGKLIRYIKPNSTVLEFGPANGRMTKYMTEELNCDVYIVEIDAEAYSDAIRYAKDGVCGDISEYTWCEKFIGVQFDFIIFADVLEHLYHPEQILLKTQEFLKDNGAVLFSVPNIAHNDILLNLYYNRFQYTSLGLLDDTHIRFFAYDSLAPLAEKSGYEIIEEDATTVEPLLTEQNILITDEMKNVFTKFTSKKELYNVYQFVCKLQKKAYVFANCIKKTSKILQNTSGVKSEFFFDRGEGYSEYDKLIVSAEKLSYHTFIYELHLDPAIKAMRFDPVEGKGCIVQNIEVLSNHGPLTPINLNGIQLKNFDVFTNTDPQFLIDFEGKETFWIKIKADIFTYEDIIWFHLLAKFKNFQDKETEMQNEIENLRDQLTEISNAYKVISTSSSWRITKPIRLMLDLIKKLIKSRK